LGISVGERCRVVLPVDAITVWAAPDIPDRTELDAAL
jgi:hypothetical protein